MQAASSSGVPPGPPGQWGTAAASRGRKQQGPAAPGLGVNAAGGPGPVGKDWPGRRLDCPNGGTERSRRGESAGGCERGLAAWGPSALGGRGGRRGTQRGGCAFVRSAQEDVAKRGDPSTIWRLEQLQPGDPNRRSLWSVRVGKVDGRFRFLIWVGRCFQRSARPIFPT